MNEFPHVSFHLIYKSEYISGLQGEEWDYYLPGKDERIASDRVSNEEKKALDKGYEEMWKVCIRIIQIRCNTNIITSSKSPIPDLPSLTLAIFSRGSGREGRGCNTIAFLKYNCTNAKVQHSFLFFSFLFFRISKKTARSLLFIALSLSYYTCSIFDDFRSH